MPNDAVVGGPEYVRVITEVLGQYYSEREVVGLTNDTMTVADMCCKDQGKDMRKTMRL